ncbi:BREX-1 system phosphatase PglZ type B [Rhodovibrio salinarum]|uniref:PglZ domain-containing protein n=1 Tax=Rhodovibrio salinarum TaxID=1087 RepID=A0A934QKD2_9PROT|nr:BREX-1 system phosphatase PglZ type B [Rhodovibrio salinarum]MBK1698289.1 hypothetical protein [Rhodovibrio salinarum]
MTEQPATLLSELARRLAHAAEVPEGEVEPAAVLWPDYEAQWQPVIAELREHVPWLYQLGDYDRDGVAETLTGPIIWLKCAVARVLNEVSPPAGTVPVIYLPGVSRATLRDAAGCPQWLQPMVELCYRGNVWHQRNGRDWTVQAFLEGELRLDLAGDKRTRKALTTQLARVAREPLTTFEGRRVDGDLLLSLDVRDPDDEVLRWMCDPDGFRRACDGAHWSALRDLWLKDFAFDPETDGVEGAAEQLLSQTSGRWQTVWQRFCGSPKQYPQMANVLNMPIKDLFPNQRNRHPGLNEKDEGRLQTELENAVDLEHTDACEKVIALRKAHAERMDAPWIELGESPLADALEPLGRLAEGARQRVGGTTLAAIADAYAETHWQCDRAARDALSKAQAQPGRVTGRVIARVVQALYRPWLDQSARAMQALLDGGAHMVAARSAGAEPEPGTCVLFIDGLRYDVGVLLQERLASVNLQASLAHRLAPLPTVTATAKAVAAPITLDGLGVGDDASSFSPQVLADGRPLDQHQLRKLLTRQGVTLVDRDDPKGPEGAGRVGWCETGKLDSLGHSLGASLVREIPNSVDEAVGLVQTLLEAGWRKVRIVTDHGWLLVPESLQKVDLPKSTVDDKWARCAAVKPGAQPGATVYPWYWDPHTKIASPPGAGSYYGGVAYAHGGISLQECVVPELEVSAGEVAVTVKIASHTWQNLRFRAQVETTASRLKVDVRRKRTAPETSFVQTVKPLRDNGEASLVVADEEALGEAAFIVVLDPDGRVVASEQTTIGGDA